MIYMAVQNSQRLLPPLQLDADLVQFVIETGCSYDINSGLIVLWCVLQ